MSVSSRFREIMLQVLTVELHTTARFGDNFVLFGVTTTMVVEVLRKIFCSTRRDNCFSSVENVMEVLQSNVAKKWLRFLTVMTYAVIIFSFEMIILLPKLRGNQCNLACCSVMPYVTSKLLCLQIHLKHIL